MRDTETQLRRLIQEALISEAPERLSPNAAKIIQRDIEKLVQVYSSITDEDVVAMETLDFFTLVKSNGKILPQGYFSEAGDDLLAVYDNMVDVKPLMAALKAAEMTDVETLKGQLTLWADKNPESALESLDTAVENLKLILRIVRKNYRSLVSKSEASPDDPLGRIAFATNRKGMPYEPNTKIEQKLAKAIGDHFEGIKMLSPEMTSLIRDLMAQGLYSSIFTEPTAAVVYRGMNVTSSKGVNWLKRLAGGRLEGEKGIIRVNTKYVPRKGSASWSTSKKSLRASLSLQVLIITSSCTPMLGTIPECSWQRRRVSMTLTLQRPLLMSAKRLGWARFKCSGSTGIRMSDISKT